MYLEIHLHFDIGRTNKQKMITNNISDTNILGGIVHILKFFQRCDRTHKFDDNEKLARVSTQSCSILVT